MLIAGLVPLTFGLIAFDDEAHLLVALGRVPNTDGLDAHAAGIELDERGFVRVNDRLETTASGTWAAMIPAHAAAARNSRSAVSLRERQAVAARGRRLASSPRQGAVHASGRGSPAGLVVIVLILFDQALAAFLKFFARHSGESLLNDSQRDRFIRYINDRFKQG